MSNFRADCSRCCGLCCIVPAQLSVQGFPADKPANTPCGHLDGCNRCSIHERRMEHGYEPCAGFDCFGAGQWITQTLFAGASWSDSPDVATHMFAAYRRWLPRFEAAALLEAALPHVRREARTMLVERIDALLNTSIVEPATHSSGGRLRKDTVALIRSLLADKSLT